MKHVWRLALIEFENTTVPVPEPATMILLSK